MSKVFISLENFSSDWFNTIAWNLSLILRILDKGIEDYFKTIEGFKAEKAEEEKTRGMDSLEENFENMILNLIWGVYEIFIRTCRKKICWW